MGPHPDVAELAHHEQIEPWTPVHAWMEKILARKGIGETVLAAATVLLFLLVFLALFHGMETRTVTGF